MKPIEILDVLYEPVVDYIVETYNKQPNVVQKKIKTLSKGKMKAYYGLTMFRPGSQPSLLASHSTSFMT